MIPGMSKTANIPAPKAGVSTDALLYAVQNPDDYAAKVKEATEVTAANQASYEAAKQAIADLRKAEAAFDKKVVEANKALDGREEIVKTEEEANLTEKQRLTGELVRQTAHFDSLAETINGREDAVKLREDAADAKERAQENRDAALNERDERQNARKVELDKQQMEAEALAARTNDTLDTIQAYITHARNSD